MSAAGRDLWLQFEPEGRDLIRQRKEAIRKWIAKLREQLSPSIQAGVWFSA